MLYVRRRAAVLYVRRRAAVLYVRRRAAVLYVRRSTYACDALACCTDCQKAPKKRNCAITPLQKIGNEDQYRFRQKTRSDNRPQSHRVAVY